MGWITANSLFESIDMAKSTEPMAIIEALENWKGGTPENPYSYRKCGPPDAAAKPGGQVKPKITDQWDYFDVKGTVPEKTADLDKVFGDARCRTNRLQDDAGSPADV